MTNDHRAGTVPANPQDRLAVARDVFIEAQRALEAARQDLLQTHAETARLWSGGR